MYRPTTLCTTQLYSLTHSSDNLKLIVDYVSVVWFYVCMLFVLVLYIVSHN